MMNLSALLRASYAYGGPYKLLLLNLRGGQVVGTILAVACYAWIVATLASRNLAVAPSNEAVVGLGTYLTLYTLASMPAMWFYFERAWFRWASVFGDASGVAGSVAVAVLTRGSTGTSCAGLFVSAGEQVLEGAANVSQACKLQKVVFATGVCNSLMFFITLALFAALEFGLMDREPGKQKMEDERSGNSDDVQQVSEPENGGQKLGGGMQMQQA